MEQHIRELAIEMAAQAWCTPETSHIEMNTRLATAFVNILAPWLEDVRQSQENAAFYRDLLDQCAAHLGPAAYTADDGMLMDEPVRLKIPDLVQEMRRKAESTQ